MANSERTNRIHLAVPHYVRAVAGGRDVSTEAWAKDHPELLPELAAELKKVQLIGAACARVLDGAVLKVPRLSSTRFLGYRSATTDKTLCVTLP